MLQENTFFENFQAYVQRYMEYENRGIENLFLEIQESTRHLSEEDKNLITQAYELGKEAHEGQMRKTGKPFFTHPLAIACMMLPYGPDAELIAATLLHDTVEDTKITMEDVEKISPVVANLVEGATKMGCEGSEDMDIYFTPEQIKFETIRKILTASQQDIRILFLKIFDRLHNMVTIAGKNPEGQKRIAEETRAIYVPLAKRCGLHRICHYLQALCMRVLEPEKWVTLETFLTSKVEYLRAESQELQNYFRQQSWSGKIVSYHTRFISPFSMSGGEYFQENNWYALHIVVPKPEDCYTILRDIGHLGDPNCIQAGEITDFINNPRFSEYSGLHFEVIFKGVKRIKVRVVPQETHDMILKGKTFSQLDHIYAAPLFRDFDLINEATSSNSEAFMESVTAHIFARKIPLHSAVNPLFYMPAGLTALDAVIYLEPKKFRFVESVYRNNEKVPFQAILNTNDIITYTFGNTITVTQGTKKDIHSGISRWRIEQLRNTL